MSTDTRKTFAESSAKKQEKEVPVIKIFVSHRIDQDSEIVDNPLYVPVRSITSARA